MSDERPARPKIAGVGAVLGGRFRLDRVIGEGAMGVVYEAYETTLARRVAVKVISTDVVADNRQRRRFEREARAAAALGSEHGVRVLDVSSPEEEPYLVMEYLEGRTLEAVILQDGRVPAPTAVDWMIQALAALAEAHARGLVHRDVKPANLFLAARDDGRQIIKVLDFGVVKDLDPTMTRITKTGAAMGSPAYMAPEQVRARPDIDARVDVWSVGVTLYELLTGNLPFSGKTLPDLLEHIIQRGPEPPLRTSRPEISEALEAVVMRCLEKDRARRYESAAQVAQALEQAMTGPSGTVRFDPPRPPQVAPTMPMHLPLGLAVTEDALAGGRVAPTLDSTPGPLSPKPPSHLARGHGAAPALAPTLPSAGAGPPVPPPPRAPFASNPQHYASIPSSNRRQGGAPQPEPTSRALIFIIAFVVVFVLGGVVLLAAILLVPQLSP